MPLAELRSLIVGLVGDVRMLRSEVDALRAENSQLVEVNGPLRLANEAMKVENGTLRDEIARLKKLPPRPPIKPSGMEKATEQDRPSRSGDKRKARGAKRDRDRLDREVVVKIEVPPGSRFKGYETCLVRDIVLCAEVVRYRRERWVTPDGKTIIAPMPDGVSAGFGPTLRQFCLIMHAQGQVTCERLTSILAGIGVDISKRQVVRLLTAGLDVFCAEDQAVLRAGLQSAPFVTVDDTGARHARHAAYTTHIGGNRFSVFRTGRAKSRLNFLSRLRAGYEDYVINDDALGYMRERGVEAQIIAKLAAHPNKVFPSQMEWLEHLAALPIDVFDRSLLRALSEGALWGSIRDHGLLDDTVIVSDDAGQFRVGNHARCWVPAERLVHKLMPATRKQEKSVKTVRDLIWRFYGILKQLKEKPSPDLARALGRRFERIFTLVTGYEVLDKLLRRLHRRKSELLKVLDYPDTPLHTNASENDIRAWVTKRKISGGTMSENGRHARDVLLGLMKTCIKLGVAFFTYLGDRLGSFTSGPRIPPLPHLVVSRG
ncbi:transposase [Rhizobium sp. 2YAF20]